MSQTLRTARLLLRPLEQEDLESIFVLRSSPEVGKYILRPLQKEKEEAQAFLDKIEKGIHDRTFEFWAIQLKEDRRCIGTICLWKFSEDRKTAEVGYDLMPEFQGQGYMSEALKTVLHLAFTILKCEAIEAFTQKGNSHSKRLLERNQFVLQESREDSGFPLNIIYRLEF